jgi:hypothetical protein
MILFPNASISNLPVQEGNVAPPLLAFPLPMTPYSQTSECFKAPLISPGSPSPLIVVAFAPIALRPSYIHEDYRGGSAKEFQHSALLSTLV